MKNTEEDVAKIDAYWRAANYLTVAFMYLKDNVFLKRDITASDVKPFASGHWGTAPGINFIIAHLNYFIKNRSARVQLTIGPGHAGNALFANLLLEGTLKDYYDLTDEKGCLDIGKVQEAITLMRTENNPFFPGTIYDGGELGYSLPVAYGTVIGEKELLHVCVIGDGEFETGTISSAWRTQLYFDNTHGMVLPIVHLNGFRMSDESMLSQYSDEQIIQYFESMNYEARIIGLNHKEMIDALEWAGDIYETKNSASMRKPVIILKSPKGFSAPDTELIHFQGQSDSHKNPLSRLSADERAEYLHKWLESYKPGELFEEDGEPKAYIKAIIPNENLRLGNSHKYYRRLSLSLPDVEEYTKKGKIRADKLSSVKEIQDYLKEIIKRNSDRFIIVSPDELKSNYLGELKDYCEETDIKSIWEVLNENICQAWMQGYIATGRNAIMISYEAFMPIVISMVNQYAKWICQSEEVDWREKRASHTYLLTSVWEANTFSHQNPAFMDYLITMQYDFVRVFYPIDANTTLMCLEDCLKSENRINAIESTKQYMEQYLDSEGAKAATKDGFAARDYIRNADRGIELVLVSIGDYCARECEAAVNMQGIMSEINIRHVAVIELTSLGNRNIYSHAMDDETFESVFPQGIPMIICYHGYETTIKALLFGRIGNRKTEVLGYKNKSIHSASDVEKMDVNGNSRYSISEKAHEMLSRNRLRMDHNDRSNKL